MIDFILIQNLINKDVIRGLLDFEFKVRERTGELPESKLHAHWNGLTFTITPGERFMKVQGSVHVFANDGVKNNDRFSYERFMGVVEILRDYILPEDRINVIEIGLNIATPFHPRDFLGSLIAHKKKRFNRIVNSRQDSCEVTHSQYKIKIYNKGIQQGGENLLRFELRVNKMQWLNRSFPKGLCWYDLQQPSTWYHLSQYLVKTLNEVIYYDPSIQLSALTSKDRAFLNKGNNPFYWEHLEGDHHGRLQKRFQSLVNRHGKRFNVIPQLIQEELRHVLPPELTENYQFGQHDLAVSLNGQSKKVAGIYQPEFDDKVPTLPEQSNEMAENYPLLDSKRLSSSGTERRCIITGLDISMQKSGSRFLNTNGLKYLYENDSEMYNQLLSEIPAEWHNTSLKKQFEKIAHHIRDQFTNPRNYYKRTIKKVLSEPSLFNNEELISDKAMAIANRL